MSFMENHVLAYKAPLYGRRTAQFKILPFDFFESRSYFKKFSDIDMAAVYGIVGGIPQYLLQMNDDLSLEENIKRCFLDPSSPLFEEPNNLLKQEVREPAIYNAIIMEYQIDDSKPDSRTSGIKTIGAVRYLLHERCRVVLFSILQSKNYGYRLFTGYEFQQLQTVILYEKGVLEVVSRKNAKHFGDVLFPLSKYGKINLHAISD